LKTIRTVRRQEYKKSINTNLKIYSSDDIDTFIQLYKLTFERQKLKIHNEQLVRSILKSLLSSNSGEIVFCLDQGNNAISSVVICHDHNCSYYLFGASDPNFRDLNPNTFLILESIKQAFTKDKEFFDFCGVNSPFRGDFKLSFNANIVPYFNVRL